MSAEIKKIERELVAELKRRGDDVTSAVLRRQITECATDIHLAARATAALRDGEAIDFDMMSKLKAAALASRVRLLGDVAAGVIRNIEVQLIPGPADWESLKAELALLKAKLARYEGQEAATATGEAAGDVSPLPSASGQRGFRQRDSAAERLPLCGRARLRLHDMPSRYGASGPGQSGSCRAGARGG